MNGIQCSRCGQVGLALPKPPLAGATGLAVQAHTCAGCWGEWQRNAPAYINHHDIKVVEPAGRARLVAAASLEAQRRTAERGISRLHDEASRPEAKQATELKQEAAPVLQVSDRPMDATVKIAKPALYRRTLPNMSPSLPRVTTSTAVATR